MPEPEIQEQDGGFIITLFKNILAEEQLTKLGLNDRQIKAVLFVKEKGKITNKDYQQLNDCSRNTASNDLADLVQRDIFYIGGRNNKGVTAAFVPLGLQNIVHQHL